MNAPDVILIIEDNETDQYVARRRLTKRWPNATVVAACDGVEAIAYLDSGSTLPDLILLDINMPRMGGHDFLAAWFGGRAIKIPIVVMLTSSTQEEDRRRSSRHPNVRGYPTKPIDKQDLEDLSAVLQAGIAVSGDRAA